MVERLFVYGTLAPNRPNEHILKEIGGEWQEASVKGFLEDKGWGSKMGYPAIKLDNSANDVEGFVFISKNLKNHWDKLDKFEGDEYKRVPTQAKLKDGTLVDVYVYELKT